MLISGTSVVSLTIFCLTCFSSAQFPFPWFNYSYTPNWNYSSFNNYGYPASSFLSKEPTDGHLFRGNIMISDNLLLNQEYAQNRSWWGASAKIIDYPMDVPEGYVTPEIISAIRIYNELYDENAARASILDGGVGYQYVKIKLESKWNHRFKYLVQIYGQ